MGMFDSQATASSRQIMILECAVPNQNFVVQYLILSGAISGIGTACWYVAEAGAIMTLAPSGARGKYLALWIVSRNLGQLVGGAIK